MKTILAKLLGISTALLAFFLPIFKAAIAGSLERLLPMALEVVTALAAGDLSSSAKRKDAFKQLEKAALKEGINASASVINLAIEAAVANLKATK
jgi:hypothetical protein